MIIKSSAFTHNTMMPRKHTCQGNDANPPLTIEGVPADAKSLVLIIDDPDAPMGVWDHWLIWNIPIGKDTVIIPEDFVPQGAIQGVNSWGNNSYGGPCPPTGTHRYFFKAFALDATLDLEEGSSKQELLNAIEGHVLAKAEMIGLYRKT